MNTPNGQKPTTTILAHDAADVAELSTNCPRLAGGMGSSGKTQRQSSSGWIGQIRTSRPAWKSTSTKLRKSSNYLRLNYSLTIYPYGVHQSTIVRE
jgi:hypothetical protein